MLLTFVNLSRILQLEPASQPQNLRAEPQKLERVTTIVDTLMTCACQNIAVHGQHGEASIISASDVYPIENDGNFRALLRYRIRSGGKILQSHMESTAKNATYL